MLATEINTPYLSAIVKDDRNIIDVFDKGLAGFSGTRALFTQDDELDPTDIVEGEATQNKKNLDNGEIMPLLAQPPSQYSSPVDAPDAPDSPPSGAQ